MACSHCFHNSVCGSSSPYSDSSQCKTFVDKDSVVAIDILHKVQIRCEELREECRDLSANLRAKEERIVEIDDELRYLRVIKQTLEMCSGNKFVY